MKTALHSMVLQIEISMSFEKYSPLTFLHVEDVFNNIAPTTLTSALICPGIDSRVIFFIRQMLGCKEIRSETGGYRHLGMTVEDSHKWELSSLFYGYLTVNQLLRYMEKEVGL